MSSTDRPWVSFRESKKGSVRLFATIPGMPNHDDVIHHDDGRVELRDHHAIESSRLYSEDLAPVPVAKRNWTTYNYAALWISMAHCIPTYMLSSGLISAGMNWWQALFTILRSEEHTSESSHANISYAVFCLKKKKIMIDLQ